MRHGQGKLIFKSGRIYEGQFDNQVPKGQGRLTIPGECYYEGETSYSRDGKFQVVGKRVLQDGTESTGTFGGC